MLAAQWQLYNDTGLVFGRSVFEYAVLTAKKIKRTLPDELQHLPHREGLTIIAMQPPLFIHPRRARYCHTLMGSAIRPFAEASA